MRQSSGQGGIQPWSDCSSENNDASSLVKIMEGDIRGGEIRDHTMKVILGVA